MLPLRLLPIPFSARPPPLGLPDHLHHRVCKQRSIPAHQRSHPAQISSSLLLPCPQIDSDPVENNLIGNQLDFALIYVSYPELFTGRLKQDRIRISMDGRGRALDNVFVERLWRSVKYENIYLNSYEDGDGWALEAGIAKYFRFYNHERFHQHLYNRRPAEVYFGTC